MCWNAGIVKYSVSNAFRGEYVDTIQIYTYVNLVVFEKIFLNYFILKIGVSNYKVFQTAIKKTRNQYRRRYKAQINSRNTKPLPKCCQTMQYWTDVIEFEQTPASLSTIQTKSDLMKLFCSDLLRNCIKW